MSCIYCHKIQLSDKLCSDCRFDPQITISLTEAKRKFKLTEEEIYKSKIFYFTFSGTYYSGTKYLRRDIVNLADKLYKNLDNQDKRKKAFNKQKELWDEYVGKIEELRIKKENVKKMILDCLIKNGIDLAEDNIMSERIDAKTDDFVDKEVNLDKDFMYCVEQGVNKLKNTYEQEKAFSERCRIMGKFIEGFEEKYHSIIRGHNLYRQYIYQNSCTYQDMERGITEAVDKQKERNFREKELIGDFEKEYLKKYVKMARNDRNFDLYIEGKITIDIAKNQIKAALDKAVAEDKRNNKLRAKFRREFKDDTDRQFALAHNWSNRFIKKGDIEIHAVIDKIKVDIENRNKAALIEAKSLKQRAFIKAVGTSFEPYQLDFIKESTEFREFVAGKLSIIQFTQIMNGRISEIMDHNCMPRKAKEWLRKVARVNLKINSFFAAQLDNDLLNFAATDDLSMKFADLSKKKTIYIRVRTGQLGMKFNGDTVTKPVGWKCPF